MKMLDAIYEIKMIYKRFALFPAGLSEERRGLAEGDPGQVSGHLTPAGSQDMAQVC